MRINRGKSQWKCVFFFRRRFALRESKDDESKDEKQENFRESQESELNALRSRQPPACLYGSSAKERQKATELTWSEIYRHKTILTKNKQCLATTESLAGGN